MDWVAISEIGRVLAIRAEEWIWNMRDAYELSRRACNVSSLRYSDRQVLDHAVIELSQLGGQCLDDWISIHLRLQEAQPESNLSHVECLDLLARIANCVDVVRGLSVAHHHVPAESR